MTILCLMRDNVQDICKFLAANHISCLGQSCKQMQNFCSYFSPLFAWLEQQRMGIEFQGVPLKMRHLVEPWGTHPIEKCQEIWDALQKCPLVFYNLNFVNNASVLIDPRFYEARKFFKEELDPNESEYEDNVDEFRDAAERLYKMIGKEMDDPRQFILACHMSDWPGMEQFFSPSLKERLSSQTASTLLCCSTDNGFKLDILKTKQFANQLSWEEQLEIADSMSEAGSYKDKALLIAIKNGMPWDVAYGIALARCDDFARKALLKILLKDDVPIEKVSEIAKKAAEVMNRSWYLPIWIEFPVLPPVNPANPYLLLNMQTWEKALAIAEHTPDPKARSKNLGLICIFISDKLPLDVAEKIAESIPDEEYRSNTLGILALGDNVPLKKALEIAHRIPLEPWKSTALLELALKALHVDSWKEAYEIALTIPDENKRSNALSRITLEMPITLKKEVLEIALSIPNEHVRNMTLFDLAITRGFSYQDALHFANQITDPDIKERALSLLSTRHQPVFSTLNMGML
jgi:hypothetical protein